MRTDNDAEIHQLPFIAWAQQHGIEYILIEPGKPMQNGYIESFNGKFRMNASMSTWFMSLTQAREATADWRRDFDEVPSL